MVNEENIIGQIQKLGVAQFLLWREKCPAGANWEAMMVSYCYHLLEIPFSDQLSRVALSSFGAIIANLKKHHGLDFETNELQKYARGFCLEIDGKIFKANESQKANDYLRSEGSSLRIVSGMFGEMKFFLLAEAVEVKRGKKTVYRLKKELALTPACHLLLAAMVTGNEVFLRESSAKFLFYQKWKRAFEESLPENAKVKLGQTMRKTVLKGLNIFEEKDFKENGKELLNLFMDNLFYHEMNHDSVSCLSESSNLLAIAESSSVFGENILTKLQEVFTDLMPEKGKKSPISNIIEGRDEKQLGLFVSDNWFYDAGMVDQETQSAMLLAPIFKWHKGNAWDWEGLKREISEINEGSLLSLYQKYYIETAEGIKAIAEDSSFVLHERPVNFYTISSYLEVDLNKKSTKAWTKREFMNGYWGNLFVYLKNFSHEGHQRVMSYLKGQEDLLLRDMNHLLGSKHPNVEEMVLAKTAEIYGAGE